MTTSLAIALGALAMIPEMNSVTARPPLVLTKPVAIPARASQAPRLPPIPRRLLVTSAGGNTKLWIAPDGNFRSQGIFLRQTQGSEADAGWTFAAANGDGAVLLQLPAGVYEFDTVEAPGQAALFGRHRYGLEVRDAGHAVVTGARDDGRGFYTVQMDRIVGTDPATQRRREALTTLANEPASSFEPESPCQLKDQVTPQRSFATDISAGFPKVRVRLPSYGHIRALIVPLDFPDVPGSVDPATVFAPLAEQVRDFYLKQSYGRLAFDFEILPSWLHLPFAIGRFGYGPEVGSGDPDGYLAQVVALTDGVIDYAQYQAVYFLVPPTMPYKKMGWGPAITAPVWVRNGYIVNGARGGADMYENETRGVIGARWKWMAHETGHAFGLYDEDLQHRSATLGNWSVMAQNWSNGAIEHNGWDRYLQGWLAPTQVACLPLTSLKGGAKVKLSPLVRQSAGTKVAMVPLSAAKILVVESRKDEGYDHLAAGNEGVLVYTVDMTVGQMGGNYRTQRRPGSRAANFGDAALRAGDAVSIDGVKVTVESLGADGDTVTISPFPSPIP